MHEAPATADIVRRVDLGPISLNVVEYDGDGPTLVLLHGIGSASSTWWPVIDALAVHFRLVVPDLRGHGSSDKPAEGYLIPDYAGDLTRLVDACGPDEPLVMGHSLGGLIALHWASRNPSRVRRLVIEDSPLRRHANPGDLFAGWIALATQPVEATAAAYAEQYPHWTVEECRRRAEMITSVALPVFTELRDRNLRDDGVDRIEALRSITCPTLLVHGDVESGGMVDIDDAERFTRLLPNARRLRIAGGSHSLHRDQADAFLNVVTPFLKGD